jgi:hypothetical protein
VSRGGRNFGRYGVTNPDDFRARRDFLQDESFGLPPDGPDPELDLIPERAWKALIALPDDVALRTTSLQGTIAEHCYDAWSAVVDSFPQGRMEESPMFEALLDLSDYLQSASFSALHGYYRQAFATLRSAIEVMIVTARFALFEGLDALRSWRYEDVPVAAIRPVMDLDRLAGLDTVTQLNVAMAPRVFANGAGTQREGWVWETFQVLSKYAHVTPGYTDGELWRSNGPVWVPSAFVLYVAMLREVLAISALLGRLADPELNRPGNPGDSFP